MFLYAQPKVLVLLTLTLLSTHALGLILRFRTLPHFTKSENKKKAPSGAFFFNFYNDILNQTL